MGKFKVRRPKGSEGCPEVTVRESPGELTRRAEEVGTWKMYINVHHIGKYRLGPLLVDYDWYAFCQALYIGIEGEDWGELYDAYKEISRPRPQKLSGKRRQPRMQEKNTTTPRVKTTPRKKRDKISSLERAPQRSKCCAGQKP